jgi:hypothetical protein
MFLYWRPLSLLRFNPFTKPKPAASFSVVIPPEMREGMTFGGALAPSISRAEALQVPAVLRARNLIAGTLSTLPIHVRDKEKQPSPAAISRLFAQFDPDTINPVVLSYTFEDLLFEAVSWWRVTSRNFNDWPTAIEHIDHSRVNVSVVGSPSVSTVSPDIDGLGRVFIDGKPVNDDDIIRFDSPNPPLLKHAARAIRTCLRLERTAALYSDTPMPQGMFTPKDGTVEMTEDEIKALLEAWKVARQSGSWAYVGGAWNAEVLSWNAEQIQLAEQRQHAVLEIARATGVDPEDLGVSTTSRTYQNSEDRRRALIDFTLAPYMLAVEQRLSMRDVLPRGYEAKFNLDGFLRSDTKTRMETYKLGKEVGAYTADEIRDLEDRPPLTPAQRKESQPPALPSPSNNGASPSLEVVNGR